MALFVPTESGFQATPFTIGPWRADAQHGGPPAALLTRAMEGVLEEDESIARVTVELVRPVPVETLSVTTRRASVSKRVTTMSAELKCGDQLVATARALALRGTTGAPTPRPDSSDGSKTENLNLAVPDESYRVEPPDFFVGDLPVTYHQKAVEHRVVVGSFGQPGPATSWLRLTQQLVEGEATSPLSLTMALADFGSGISSIYATEDRFGLINADLSIAFARPPVGDWIRLDSETTTNDLGLGLCVTQLGDTAGNFGVATQSLLGLTM